MSRSAIAAKLISRNGDTQNTAHVFSMPTILFKCPYTGQNASGWYAEILNRDADRLEAIICPACRQVHAINPTSGMVYGQSSVNQTLSVPEQSRVPTEQPQAQQQQQAQPDRLQSSMINNEKPQDYSGRQVQLWVWLFPAAALLVVGLAYLYFR